MFMNSKHRSSRHKSRSLLKTAAGAYLTAKVLPFGSGRKKQSGVFRKLMTGFVAMKVLPKAVKWIGGGALLASALGYGYSRYQSRRFSRIEGEGHRSSMAGEREFSRSHAAI